VENILDFEGIFLLVNQKLTLIDRQALLQNANQPVPMYKQKARAVEAQPKGEGKKSPSGDKTENHPKRNIPPSAPKASSAPNSPVQKSEGKISQSIPPQQRSAPPTPTMGKGANVGVGFWTGERPPNFWSSGGRGPPSPWQGNQWQGPNATWKGSGNRWNGQSGPWKGGKGFDSGWNFSQPKGGKAKGKGDQPGKGKGGRGGGRG
jgi:hypothetical protein